MKREEGSASIFGVAAIVVICLAGMVVIDVMTLIDARTRAINAADAAALAAAPVTFEPGDPKASASRLAERNGAKLAGCSCEKDSSLVTRRVKVQVSVSVEPFFLPYQSVSATSTAEYDPLAALGG